MECIFRCHAELSHPRHAPEGNKQIPGHVELARVLLEHGADVNAQDDEKHTMLDWASNGNGAYVKAQCTSRKRRRGYLSSGVRRRCDRLNIENRTTLRLASGTWTSGSLSRVV
jgi:hypothetical protein